MIIREDDSGNLPGGSQFIKFTSLQVRKLQSTPLGMKNIGKYWRQVAKKSRKSLSRQGKVVILQADYYQGTQKSPIFSV
jgi:hypothetical protein